MNMKAKLKRALVAVAVLLLLAVGAGLLYLRLDPKRRLARHIVKAGIGVKGGQYRVALNEYQAALELDPRNEFVLAGMGNVRLALEQPERAVENFEACLALHPEYTPAWAGLIRARLALKQQSAAIAAAQRMLRQRRDDATLLLYGDALRANNDFLRALEAYAQAAEIAPDKPEPVLRRADLLSRLQRIDECRQLLEAYEARDSAAGREQACLRLGGMALNLRQPAEALRWLERGIAIKPGSELNLERAAALSQLGRFADGRKAIDALQAALPEGAGLPPGALKIRALCLLETGDARAALRDAQQAARALNGDPELALTLARIHYKEGRAMQAQEEARRALALAPGDAAAQNFLLLMLLDRHDYEQAIGFGKTLRAGPHGSSGAGGTRNEAALRLLVRAYLAAGRPDDALKDIAPLSAPLAASRVIAPLPGSGEDLERLRKLPTAERENATTQFLLAQAWLRAGKLRDCVHCLARSKKLDPGRLETEMALARIRMALGQNVSAQADFEALLQRHPNCLPARLLLAQAYIQNGKPPNAKPGGALAQLKPYVLAEGLDLNRLALLLQAQQGQTNFSAWNGIASELCRSSQPARQADGRVMNALAITLAPGSPGSSSSGSEALARAAEECRQALVLLPAHPLALHEGALIALRQGRNDDALAMLRKLDDSRLAPEAHERLDLAVALLVAKNYGEARAVAFEEYTLRRTPETLLALLAIEEASGRREAARKLLERTPQASFELLALARLAQTPAAAEIFAQLAFADMYARNWRPRWALDCFDQALALAPENADLAVIRAKALFTAGVERNAAAAVVERALKADPRRADLTMLLAGMRQAQQRPQEAARLYRQVLVSRPDEHRALVMAGTLLMGSEYSGDKNDAAALLLRAVKSAPLDVMSLNNYVWLLGAVLQRPHAALPYAEDLERLAPDNPSALDTSGWIYFLNERYDKALSALEYAALLAPENGDIAAHYALALLKSGQPAGAKKELDRARTLKRGIVSGEELKADAAPLD